MPVLALLVKCKECGYEIRSDWKYCPSCGDKIICPDKYEIKKKK